MRLSHFITQGQEIEPDAVSWIENRMKNGQGQRHAGDGELKMGITAMEAKYETRFSTKKGIGHKTVRISHTHIHT